MKTYVKPTIEVISMRTSENIADNNIIKTIYTKAADATEYNTVTSGTYSEDYDITGSQNLNV